MVCSLIFSRILFPPSSDDKGEDEEQSQPSAEKMGSVRLDMRQLLRVLSSHQLMPSNVVACLFDEKALVLHVFAATLYVMYEVPHVQG